MKQKFLLALSAIGLLFVMSCSKNDEVATANNDKVDPVSAYEPGSKFVPNEVIVKFKSGITEQAKMVAINTVSGSIKEKIVTPSMLKSASPDGIMVLNVTESVPNAIKKLKLLGEVEYAEPNYIYTTQAVSNDTYFTNGNLWGMYGDASTPANQYGSQAAEAWAAGHVGTNTVYVGIIDEGYMYAHTDLAANAGKNPGEIAGNGIDDDGNGYKDDVYGWDFAGNNSSVYDGTADDHGTHVAGTIGGVGGNGAGVAGVCWNVKLIGCKFLGATGGTTANAIKAIDYFVDLKTRHNLNLVAINNSWGGGGFSQALSDAIGRANAANIIFVAAAGNGGSDQIGDNNETTPNYPSNYTQANIIAVAAITSTGALASYSNYGVTSVDIGAPGSSVYSTIPKTGNKSGYGSMSGTSMATPHVTGACALYASTHPGATMSQIINAIYTSGVATTSLNGKCVTGKRLNVSGF